VRVLDVELPNAYRRQRAMPRPVIGVDCESLLSGYAFLICDSRGRSAWIKSFDDVIAFFNHEDYPYCMLVAFNLNFDASVMLKWAGKEICTELALQNRISIPECHIEYIPGKYLQFRFGNKFVRIFDVAQFFQGSLDWNAKTYLGKAKKSLPTKSFTEADYYNSVIEEYCVWDATLTAGLGDYVVNAFDKLDVGVGTLASPATILECYMLDQLLIRNPVHTVPKGALEMAMKSFNGAWFENFKAGSFPKTYRYDLVSAYPCVIKDLVDLSLGHWVNEVKRPKGALYGYVRCKVTVPKTYISPIMFRNQNGDVLHPHGTWSTHLTMIEVDWGRAHNGKVEIYDAWWFIPFTKVKKFEGVVNKFFAVKRDSKADSMEKWSAKIALTGMYGKFLQHRGGHGGRLYNPVYATEITSQVRLQLADACMMNPESMIAVMSDCAVATQPLSLPLGKELGDWSKKGPDASLWIGPVQYEAEGQDYRFRRIPWRKLLEEHPGVQDYDVVRNGPLTLTQAIALNRFDDIGVFADMTITFNIRKLNWRRFWPSRPVKGGDLLTKQYDSRQIHVTSRLKPEDMVLWEMEG